MACPGLIPRVTRHIGIRKLASAPNPTSALPVPWPPRCPLASELSYIGGGSLNLLPFGRGRAQLAADQCVARSDSRLITATPVHLAALACATHEQTRKFEL